MIKFSHIINITYKIINFQSWKNIILSFIIWKYPDKNFQLHYLKYNYFEHFVFESYIFSQSYYFHFILSIVIHYIRKKVIETLDIFYKTFTYKVICQLFFIIFESKNVDNILSKKMEFKILSLKEVLL